MKDTTWIEKVMKASGSEGDAEAEPLQNSKPDPDDPTAGMSPTEKVMYQLDFIGKKITDVSTTLRNC